MTENGPASLHYLMVMPGVVVAFALGRLLHGVASLLSRRQEIRPYWIHHVWAFLVLALLIQYWHTTSTCTVGKSLPEYSLFFIFPVMGYFACAVLMPMELPAGEFRFRDHYHHHAVLFFAICCIGMVSEILLSSLFSCGTDGHSVVENRFRGLGAGAAFGLVCANRVTNVRVREWIHRVVTLLALLFFLVFVCWRSTLAVEERDSGSSHVDRSVNRCGASRLGPRGPNRA